MARSELDLANAALGYLVRDRLRNLDGSDLATTQTSGNLEQAKEEVIEAWDWPECRVVGSLTLAGGIDTAGWAYAYIVPADAIKIWSVGEYLAARSVPYARGMSIDIGSDTQYILTNLAEAKVRYGSSRANIARFSAQVFDLMALKLAALCCMSLAKDAKLHQYLSKEYDKRLSAARTSAANAEPEVIDIEFTPEVISVRSQ